MINVIPIDFAQLAQLDLKDKNLVIIGHPGAGKTHLASMLAPNLNQIFIDTDDFKALGDFVTQLSHLLDRLDSNSDKKYCIVGVLGYRLLRHIAKHPDLHDFRPDAVIEVTRDVANIVALYGDERDINKLGSSRALAKGCETVLKEYLNLVDPVSAPTYYELYNTN